MDATDDDHAEWVCERCGVLKLAHDIGQPWRRSLQSGLALCDACHLAERKLTPDRRMQDTVLPPTSRQQLTLF